MMDLISCRLIGSDDLFAKGRQLDKHVTVLSNKPVIEKLCFGLVGMGEAWSAGYCVEQFRGLRAQENRKTQNATFLKKVWQAALVGCRCQHGDGGYPATLQELAGTGVGRHAHHLDQEISA